MIAEYTLHVGIKVPRIKIRTKWYTEIVDGVFDVNTYRIWEY